MVLVKNPVAFVARYGIGPTIAGIYTGTLDNAGERVKLDDINATLYAVSANAARRMLESPRAQRRFNLVGGSLICTAGAWALMAKRQVP